MTYKRRALQALTKQELLEISREFELEVVVRMNVDGIRDAVGFAPVGRVAGDDSRPQITYP